MPEWKTAAFRKRPAQPMPITPTFHFMNGFRPNNDLDQLTVSLQLKDQVTPHDGAYFQAVYYHATAGDLRQYYAQTNASPFVRTKETQEPLLIAGWHHEWSPQSHT